jgi:hypothetical protein
MNKAEIQFFKEISKNVLVHLERLDKNSTIEEKELLISDIVYQTIVNNPQIFTRVSETHKFN